jgi:hypothetical protein
MSFMPTDSTPRSAKSAPAASRILSQAAAVRAGPSQSDIQLPIQIGTVNGRRT